MKHKHILAAVLVTYLVMSFAPGIGLFNLIGKKPPMQSGA